MSGQGSAYRVVYHRAAQEQLGPCIDGLLVVKWDKEALVAIIEEIERRLEKDPSNCGELLFHLRPLDLVVGVVCVRPFSLQFGIHEKTRTVFVRGVCSITLGQA